MRLAVNRRHKKAAQGRERGGEEMRSYIIRIEVEEGEVDKILQELFEAQEKISQCYNRLTEIGVVTIRDKAASGN